MNLTGSYISYLDFVGGSLPYNSIIVMTITIIIIDIVINAQIDYRYVAGPDSQGRVHSRCSS